jgi:hypothetical protein
MERCEFERLISLFGALTVESRRVYACVGGTFTDEVAVVGLDSELLVVEDIIDIRLSHDDDGRLLAAPLSCVEVSSTALDRGFVTVCRRRRSLLLCDSTKLCPESVATGWNPVRCCDEYSLGP